MDESLRDLERAFRQRGDRESEVRWLAARVRSGDLAAERLELAAWLGHAPALEALGRDPAPVDGGEAELAPRGEEEDSWDFEVRRRAAFGESCTRWGRDVALRFAVAAAWTLPRWRDRVTGPDDELLEALEALDAAVDASPEEAASLLAAPLAVGEADAADGDRWSAPAIDPCYLAAARAVLAPDAGWKDLVRSAVVDAGSRRRSVDELRARLAEELVPWAIDGIDPSEARSRHTGRRLGREESIVRRVLFTPDGAHAISTSQRGTVTVYGLGVPENARSLPRQDHDLYGADVFRGPSGSARVVVGDMHGTIRVLAVEDGAVVLELETGTGDLRDLAVLGGGERLVVASGSSVRLFDLASGAAGATLAGAEPKVGSLAASPCGTRVALGDASGVVRIVDPVSGAVIAASPSFRDTSIQDVAFVGGADRVAVAVGAEVIVWDAAAGTIVARIERFEATVYAVAASPDGRLVVAASSDQTVRIFDAASGRELGRHDGHAIMLAVAVSPDGRQALAGSRNGAVRLFDLPEPELEGA